MSVSLVQQVCWPQRRSVPRDVDREHVHQRIVERLQTHLEGLMVELRARVEAVERARSHAVAT